MREGYKDSVIGEIPIDWEIVRQVDVATFFNGRAYKLTEWETKGTPVIRLQNLTGTGKDYYYSNLILPKHQYCYNGDLLYMWSATFGPVWWKREKAIYHYHIWKIEHDNKRLNRNFHFYLLDDVTMRMKNESHGSTMLHVTKEGMEKLLIQLPPLPEQQKIAEILSTVDDKIDVIDQQISETQALKKGLMQRLLTKGIGHTEFKDSPLGEIPKSWEVVNLGDISEVKGRIGYRGYTKADLVEKGKGALAIGGAQINKQNRLNLSQPVYLTWEKYEESPEIKVEEGHIVFAQRGTLGRTALIESLPELATINPSMVLIKNITCNNKLLYYYLCSGHVQDIVTQISTATAVPMISQKQIKEFKIGIPPRDEQLKIANILSSVDEKLEVLEDKKTHYQELKQGLMQQLLTGKIRVNGLINKPTMA